MSNFVLRLNKSVTCLAMDCDLSVLITPALLHFILSIG